MSQEQEVWSPMSEDELKCVFKRCKSFIMYPDSKTCVFWDVEEYPIPNGMDLAKTVENIKEAIKKGGCSGEVSIHAYVDHENRLVSDDDGTKITVFPKGENKHERAHFIVFDVLLFLHSLEDPSPPSNLIILSKNIIRRDMIYHFRSFSKHDAKKIYLSFDCAEPILSSQLLLSNKIDDILHSDSSDQCAASPLKISL